MNKTTRSSFSMLNYFVIQEVLGFLFLLTYCEGIQVFILLIKVGVPPLHFWVFRVSSGFSNVSLLWFLTLHKIPYLSVLCMLMNEYVFYLLLFGILVCLVQSLSVKDHKISLILSSIESFNWLLILCDSSASGYFCLRFYYLGFMYFVLSNYGKKVGVCYSWLLVFMIMNIPLSGAFFIKIFSLFDRFNFSSFYLLFVLIIYFIRILGNCYLLFDLSIKHKFNYQSLIVYYFFVMPYFYAILV